MDDNGRSARERVSGELTLEEAFGEQPAVSSVTHGGSYSSATVRMYGVLRSIQYGVPEIGTAVFADFMIYYLTYHRVKRVSHPIIGRVGEGGGVGCLTAPGEGRGWLCRVFFVPTTGYRTSISPVRTNWHVCLSPSGEGNRIRSPIGDDIAPGPSASIRGLILAKHSSVSLHGSNIDSRCCTLLLIVVSRLQREAVSLGM